MNRHDNKVVSAASSTSSCRCSNSRYRSKLTGRAVALSRPTGRRAHGRNRTLTITAVLLSHFSIPTVQLSPENLVNNNGGARVHTNRSERDASVSANAPMEDTVRNLNNCQDNADFVSISGFSCIDLEPFTSLFSCTELSSIGFSDNEIHNYTENCQRSCRLCARGPALPSIPNNGTVMEPLPTASPGVIEGQGESQQHLRDNSNTTGSGGPGNSEPDAAGGPLKRISNQSIQKSIQVESVVEIYSPRAAASDANTESIDKKDPAQVAFYVMFSVILVILFFIVAALVLYRYRLNKLKDFSFGFKNFSNRLNDNDNKLLLRVDSNSVVSVSNMCSNSIEADFPDFPVQWDEDSECEATKSSEEIVTTFNEGTIELELVSRSSSVGSANVKNNPSSIDLINYDFGKKYMRNGNIMNSNNDGFVVIRSKYRKGLTSFEKYKSLVPKLVGSIFERKKSVVSVNGKNVTIRNRRFPSLSPIIGRWRAANFRRNLSQSDELARGLDEIPIPSEQIPHTEQWAHWGPTRGVPQIRGGGAAAAGDDYDDAPLPYAQLPPTALPQPTTPMKPNPLRLPSVFKQEMIGSPGCHDGGAANADHFQRKIITLTSPRALPEGLSFRRIVSADCSNSEYSGVVVERSRSELSKKSDMGRDSRSGTRDHFGQAISAFEPNITSAVEKNCAITGGSSPETMASEGTRSSPEPLSKRDSQDFGPQDIIQGMLEGDESRNSHHGTRKPAEVRDQPEYMRRRMQPVGRRLIKSRPSSEDNTVASASTRFTKGTLSYTESDGESLVSAEPTVNTSILSDQRDHRTYKQNGLAYRKKNGRWTVSVGPETKQQVTSYGDIADKYLDFIYHYFVED